MCPPASIGPAAEVFEYWTDEAVFKFLMQLKSGCSLPSNILTDEDPYQSTPSSLHDMWYFWSGTKKDAENGFWRSTGEACEIYSTSGVTGSRKTLEFYEGQQKTNWVMQQYTTTDKYSSKPDNRALYRVFLVDNISSGQQPKSQLLEKNTDDVAGPSAIDKDLEDCVSKGDYLELDDLDIPPTRATSFPNLGEYVSRGVGDYLEMNDLVIPLSRTTSSTDSSCMTMTSEEYFDSEALMREIGDDNGAHEIQESKIHLNLSVPAKLKEVVEHPTTLESLDSGEKHKPCTGQTSKTGPTPENHRNASSSSSSSSEGSSKEEKKDGSKKRKMMKYLCFLAF